MIDFSFLYSSCFGTSFDGVYARVSRPSPSTVTRFSGSGRSSVESQKSIACFAIFSSVQPGASFVSIGFSPWNIGACDFPTIWMFPSG